MATLAKGGRFAHRGMSRTKPLRRSPLGADYDELKNVKPERRKRRLNDEEDDESQTQQTLSAAMSKKILDVVREQRAGERLGSDEECGGVGGDGKGLNTSDDDDWVSDDVDENDEGIMVDVEEEDDLRDFLLKNLKTADIGQPTKERQTDRRRDISTSDVPTDVVEAYQAVGVFLARYKSGKLPKLFKIIPRLVNWEEMLYHTNPEEWTSNALCQATKLFASNLNPKMAQRFYNLVLLPAFREDLAANKKTNPHIYAALKKAMFKPAAWFKGIYLSIADDECTYLEAVILGSVLKKVSVPMLHAAAALMRLCKSSPWRGTTSLLMTALIDKRFSLPQPVTDALVDHFCSFGEDEEESDELPLVWHRCLLSFVQFYKDAVNDAQRRRMRELLRVHKHHLVGSEIVRELNIEKKSGGMSVQQEASILHAAERARQMNMIGG